MNRALLFLLSMLFSLSVFSGDFVNQFIEQYGSSERPLDNVNIGKTMLEKMADNTSDEELKNAFKELKSIRIVSSSNQEDSQYFFEKANNLVKESFYDYEEVASVNTNSKVSVYLKRESSDMQDLILITIDNSGKFSLITLSGKIDFNSISKLSGSLKNGTDIAIL